MRVDIESGPRVNQGATRCGTGKIGIARVNLEGGIQGKYLSVRFGWGNLRRVTAGPKYDTRPAFSPDGSKLAFQSNRDGNYEIYVMNLR